MTITALACPEPPNQPQQWRGGILGDWHAVWCSGRLSGSCSGDCSTGDQFGGVHFGAYLPRDLAQPKITICDPVTGTVVELDGATAAQLAQRILSVTNSAGIPAIWLRPQP